MGGAENRKRLKEAVKTARALPQQQFKQSRFWEVQLSVGIDNWKGRFHEWASTAPPYGYQARFINKRGSAETEAGAEV